MANAEIFLQFIIRLKSFRVGAFLSELANLDHNNGPKYLIECLPYFTVLYLGRIKSEFRRLYGFKPIFGMLPAEPRMGQFKFPARQPYARLLFFKLYLWEDFTHSLLHSLPVLRNPERGRGELPYEKKRDGRRQI